MTNLEKKRSVNRRDFMKAASGATLAAATSMKRAAAATNANDKINIGIIGVGSRGKELLRELLFMPDYCKVVAVCDVYQRRVDDAVDMCAGQNTADVKTFTRHPDLLELPELDAVVVATPDHWHAEIGLAVMDKDKDLYLEKPMAHTIAEARTLVAKEKASGKIVQIGSQYCQEGQFWNARAAIQAGHIGRVVLSQASIHRNESRGYWNTRTDETAGPNKKGPDFIDWEWWQKPSPEKYAWAKTGFDRYWHFRKYWDYSGGVSTDLFFHIYGALNVVWGNFQSPYRVVGTGGLYQYDDGRDVPDVFTVSADYPSGHSVLLTSSLNNATPLPWVVRGHQGTIHLSPGGSMARRVREITVTPERTWKEHRSTFKAKHGDALVMETPERVSHLQNFFECVRSREEPLLSARRAYHLQVVSDLGVESYKCGQVLYYDEDTDSISNLPPKDFSGFPVTPGWRET